MSGNVDNASADDFILCGDKNRQESLDSETETGVKDKTTIKVEDIEGEPGFEMESGDPESGVGIICSAASKRIFLTEQNRSQEVTEKPQPPGEDSVL